MPIHDEMGPADDRHRGDWPDSRIDDAILDLRRRADRLSDTRERLIAIEHELAQHKEDLEEIHDAIRTVSVEHAAAIRQLSEVVAKRERERERRRRATEAERRRDRRYRIAVWLAVGTLLLGAAGILVPLLT